MIITFKIQNRLVIFKLSTRTYIPGIKGAVAMTLATSFHKYKAMSNPKMTRNGLKWPKKAKNGQKWPKMAKTYLG